MQGQNKEEWRMVANHTSHSQLRGHCDANFLWITQFQGYHEAWEGCLT